MKRAPLLADRYASGLAYALTLANVWLWSYALARLAELVHTLHH